MKNATNNVSAQSIRRWGRRLKAFRQRYGHARVPIRYGRDPGLGRWCAQARRNFHRWPVERLKNLLRLRFNFGWDVSFVVGFCALADFKCRHGHCLVSRHSGGSPLALWVHRQRSAAKRLIPQRRHLLERLGFDWDPFETQWRQRYGELCKFRQIHGHCEVPQHGRTAALGRWVVRQRLRCHQSGRKNRQLSSRQKELLNKLGFEWVPKVSRWQRRLGELQAFQRRHGTGKVPSGEAEPVLGAWVAWQRKRKSMPVAQRKQLEALGLEWHPVQAHWQRRYGELRAFKQKFGSCSVPSGWPPNPGLGDWVTRLRRRGQRGSLTPPQRRQLDQLGFNWVGNPMPPRQSWEERFRELRKFKQRFGHCQVPAAWAENKPLGAWVRHQRVLHHQGELSPLRRRRLDELGFSWRVARRRLTVRRRSD